jgi:hypothetical protein
VRVARSTLLQCTTLPAPEVSTRAFEEIHRTHADAAGGDDSVDVVPLQRGLQRRLERASRIRSVAEVHHPQARAGRAERREQHRTVRVADLARLEHVIDVLRRLAHFVACRQNGHAWTPVHGRLGKARRCQEPDRARIDVGAPAQHHLGGNGKK